MRAVFLLLFVCFAAEATTGCGLFEGGPDLASDAGSGMDVTFDLNVEDRGMGMTDTGMSCTCVPPDAEMNGWSYVGSNLAPGACPMGWNGASSGTLKKDPKAMNYACQCSCTKVDPSCSVAGNITFNYHDFSNCSDGPNTKTTAAVVNGCAQFDQGGLGSNGNNSDEWVKIGLQNPPTADGKCTGALTKLNGTITATDVQLCAFEGKSSKCMNNDACVVPPSGAYRMCVWKMGPAPMTCPAGFPLAMDGLSPGPSYVGTMIDTSKLACPDCNCTGAPGTCTNPVVGAFEDTACSQNMKSWPNAVPADNTCQSHGQQNDFHPRSYYLSVTKSLTCTPGYTMQAQTGSPELSGMVYAVCCR